jgi:1,2-diacylglycerol 3-alpha-glucosyltransferase
MRVLMVTDVYFPRINGVSTSIETFRRGLASQGVEVVLVAPRYAGEPDDPELYRVDARPVPRDPEDRLMHWRGALRTVRREASECDLIHIHTPFVAHYAGLRAARELGKPVLATYHTLFEEYLHHYLPVLPSRITRALARHLSRTQCNALDAIVVPSRAMSDRLRAYGVTRPLHIQPTGVQVSRYALARDDDAGSRFRAAHGIEAERPVALYVGRVAHEKNIGFLLEAVAAARRVQPDLLLLISGEGPAEASLKAHANNLGLDGAVRFLGYLDRNRDLPAAYAAADAFVFASRTETQGLVLLEALAAMGTADILDSRLGCLVPNDSVDEFAATLLALLGDTTLARRLSVEARAQAQAWDDIRMSERLAQLYRTMLAERG